MHLKTENVQTGKETVKMRLFLKYIDIHQVYPSDCAKKKPSQTTVIHFKSSEL